MNSEVEYYVGNATGPSFANDSGDPLCRPAYEHSVQVRFEKAA